MKALELKEALINELSLSDKIKGIGQTGSLETVLIPGKSDIDLFVLCSKIPTEDERKIFYTKLNSFDFSLQMKVCNGGIWGYGDILFIDGIDVMPMYFTITEMKQYLEEVLAGKHMYKDGRFYPVGRLASISSINILFEKDNTWTSLKELVNQKTDSFFKSWFEVEINQVLDEEDLGRSELRKEILFFHQVLENAIDHLLQALYAINYCYFPSRKRTMTTIDTFKIKPENCNNRLLMMIKNAVSEDTLLQSINELKALTKEIKILAESVFLF